MADEPYAVLSEDSRADKTSAATTKVISPILVGRQVELETSLEVVSVPPAVVAVDGEAGVGKTRLIAELLTHPAVVTRHRVMGRCHPIREPFPLGPVIEAMRGLHAVLGDHDLSPVTGALRPLLPELADVLPPTPEPLDDRIAERHRVFRGLAAGLDVIGPAVLVLDDLHWADDQTLDFLAYLVDEVPPQLSLVLVYRAEEAPPTLKALTTRLPEPVSRVHLSLGPLDADQTGELVAGIVGSDHVSEEFAAYLWERTAGLPLAVEELLALARARGLIVERDGRWERRTLDQIEVPSGIREPTLERVAHLSDAARRLAEAAAVVQIPADPRALGDISGTGSADVLDEALRSGLLVEHGDRVGFRHLLAARAVYDALSHSRRRTLHSQAADALRDAEPVPLGQIAHHLRRAGRLVEWAHAAESAADRAVEMANDEEAVRLLDDVLRSAPLEPDERARLAAKLGRAAHETLQARAVIDLLSEALDQEPAPVLRGELRLALALALNQCGEDLSRQLRLLTAAVPDLRDRPALRASAAIILCALSPRSVPLSDDLVSFEQALKLVDEVDDRLLQTWAFGRVGAVMITAAHPGWRELVDRVVELTGGAPQQRREVNAFIALGRSASFAGHLAIADDLLGRGREARATQENPRLAILLQSARAHLAFFQGEWHGLADHVLGLMSQLSDTADVWHDLQLIVGNLALAHGDIDDAHRRLTEVLDAADRLDHFQLLPPATGGTVRVALSRGETKQAVDQVGRCLAMLTTKEVWAPVDRLLPFASQALIAGGLRSDARDLVERAVRETRGLDAPLLPAAVRCARGVVESSPHDLLAAAEQYEMVRAPYEAGWAREQAASCFLAGGDTASAASAIRAAVAEYDRLGATWDRSRAASIAREHGLRLPAAHRGGPRGYGTQLSPREERVAALAVAGRTNTEIAAELFISKKTVEKHLTAAMRKLSVRSRVELATTWSRRADS